MTDILHPHLVPGDPVGVSSTVGHSQYPDGAVGGGQLSPYRRGGDIDRLLHALRAAVLGADADRRRPDYDLDAR